MNIPPQFANVLMQQLGGPEQFQKAINSAQNMLQQQNITMEQFMQSPQQYVQQIVPQDRLQWAMQQANAIYGRK
jgi:hypothetical protein